MCKQNEREIFSKIIEKKVFDEGSDTLNFGKIIREAIDEMKDVVSDKENFKGLKHETEKVMGAEFPGPGESSISVETMEMVTRKLRLLSKSRHAFPELNPCILKASDYDKWDIKNNISIEIFKCIYYNQNSNFPDVTKEFGKYIMNDAIKYDNVTTRLRLRNHINGSTLIAQLVYAFGNTLTSKVNADGVTFVILDKSCTFKILEIIPIKNDGNIHLLEIKKINGSSINSYHGVLKHLKSNLDQIGYKVLPSWDEYFMLQAIITSLRSKDPCTQVGAVIVKDNNMIGAGYNGMCSGIDESKVPWGKMNTVIEETKYPYVVHAELNAILNSTQSCKKATLYVTKFPCNECAKAIIQSGIRTVVVNETASEPDKISVNLFRLAGVKVTTCVINNIREYI